MVPTCQVSRCQVSRFQRPPLWTWTIFDYPCILFRRVCACVCVCVATDRKSGVKRLHRASCILFSCLLFDILSCVIKVMLGSKSFPVAILNVDYVFASEQGARGWRRRRRPRRNCHGQIAMCERATTTTTAGVLVRSGGSVGPTAGWGIVGRWVSAPVGRTRFPLIDCERQPPFCAVRSRATRRPKILVVHAHTV